jgi:hypothetical protein
METDTLSNEQIKVLVKNKVIPEERSGNHSHIKITLTELLCEQTGDPKDYYDFHDKPITELFERYSEISETQKDIESAKPKKTFIDSGLGNPYSTNFTKLGLYNDNYLSFIEERILFEYILMMSGVNIKRGRCKFKLSARKILDDTRIKQSVQKRIILFFEEEELIIRTIEGIPCTTNFQVNYTTILKKLRKIYKPEANKLHLEMIEKYFKKLGNPKE